MKNFIFICAVLFGSYVSADSDGVGAFAFQDSTGNRYGGTYGLKDGQVVNQKGNWPPNFTPPNFQFQDFDDFFPDYFRNLENLLQEIHPYYTPPTFYQPPSYIRRPFIIRPPIFNFNRTFESKADQSSAYDAARKAFDLTSNQAGYIPNFASRFQVPFDNNFGGFGGFDNMPGPHNFPGIPFQVPDFGRNDNSAFASAAVGNDFSQQMAGISPANPNNPNINKVNRLPNRSGGGDFKSVSSSSHVSSSIGPDGKVTSNRRAQTTVNNNGDIKTYKVES